MISKSDLLKGRDQQYPADYTQEVSDNLDKLLTVIQKIEAVWGSPFVVTSGWRPAELNGLVSGAAPHSKHIEGLAADISDATGALWVWVMNNLELMKEFGAFMEDKRWTPSWVHFQIVPPASGHRVFIPSVNRATAPTAWNGVYDHSYDEQVPSATA